MTGVTENIAAIREFRSRHGCSLAEARDAIAHGWTADTWANRFRRNNERDAELLRLEKADRMRRAAPAMLEALHQALAVINGVMNEFGTAPAWELAAQEISAAIAKAEGEP